MLLDCKTVLLYDRRFVRPDTISEIMNAKDGEVVIVDSSVLNAFTQLLIVNPGGSPKNYKSVLLCSKFRPEVVARLMEADDGALVSADASLLGSFLPITFLESSMPKFGDNRVAKPRRKGRRLQAPEPKTEESTADAD